MNKNWIDEKNLKIKVPKIFRDKNSWQKRVEGKKIAVINNTTEGESKQKEILLVRGPVSISERALKWMKGNMEIGSVPTKFLADGVFVGNLSS